MTLTDHQKRLLIASLIFKISIMRDCGRSEFMNDQILLVHKLATDLPDSDREEWLSQLEEIGTVAA